MKTLGWKLTQIRFVFSRSKGAAIFVTVFSRLHIPMRSWKLNIRLTVLWTRTKWSLLKPEMVNAQECDITKLGSTKPHRWGSIAIWQALDLSLGIWGNRTVQDTCWRTFSFSSFEDDRKLDPVCAIKLYFRQIRKCRRWLSKLFVTYRAGLPKSLSAQTIFHWIVDAIEATLVTANAGPVQANSTWAVLSQWLYSEHY